MLKTLTDFINKMFSKETCAECGEKMTEENTVPVNNGENICAKCYAHDIMKNSHDAYEIMYQNR